MAMSPAAGAASRIPTNTDSVRVSPPTTTLCTFSKAASRHSCPMGTMRSSRAATIISVIQGHPSSARSVRMRTGISPRGKSTLSSPIRVERPAAGTTAEQVKPGSRSRRNRRFNNPIGAPPSFSESKKGTLRFLFLFPLSYCATARLMRDSTSS